MKHNEITPFTRKQIEDALDAGKLEVLMTNGNWWTCRRNGKTKTWKTRPDDFRIPVKCGFRTTFQLTPTTLAFHYGHMRIKSSNES